MLVDVLREACGEVFAVSGDAVDKGDDDEKIADDERDGALFIFEGLFYRGREMGGMRPREACVPPFLLWPLR